MCPPPPPTLTVLFIMVERLHFSLACLTPVFACVALMLVSMDRTAGARIVASGVMVSCAFCGIVLGGCLVSRVCGRDLSCNCHPTSSRFYLIKPHTYPPLPRWQASLAWLARSSSVFWILLIILPTLILVPVCAARATAVGLGIPICMVISIMLGNLVRGGCRGGFAEGRWWSSGGSGMATEERAVGSRQGLHLAATHSPPNCLPLLRSCCLGRSFK